MDGTFRGEQVPLVLPPMATEKNFSRYFPPSKEFQDCGCHVVSFGFESVGAGADYPLREHPRDHLFSYRRGRVLSSYVIEFLVSGEGWVESTGRAIRTRRSEFASSAGVLFHRCRGDFSNTHSAGRRERAGWEHQGSWYLVGL
jgi:hypothetical protein